MVEIYGQSLTRRELAQRSGALSQFAGVRLMTLENGVERGVRVLEFRTGSGLRFTVMIDRAMDIGDCEHHGRAVGWHSPSGFQNPALHQYEGEGGLGWLRAMSGLIVTCGLDHILFMDEDDASHYFYGPRKTVKSSLHGRVGTIPALLTGYGERWDGDDCILWAEGVVQQSTVFGEDLHLIRRIEARVGGNEIELHDRVVNHGFYRTPHMFCYHVNVGHPVLAEGSRYVAPIRDVIWAAHAGDAYQHQGVGYRRSSGPKLNFHEQVWQHDMAADDNGKVRVALINDALGFGFEVETFKSQFPAMYEWQNFQAGHYAFGIEPSTNHVFGKQFARQRDELIWLEHGEERRYDSIFRVLPDPMSIAESLSQIRAVAPQPEGDYPNPSGIFSRILNQDNTRAW